MREVFRLCFVLTVIAAVSAGVLAFVSQQTAEPIAKSLLDEKMNAVRSVLPPFDNEPGKDTVVLKSAGLETTFYRGRVEGEIVGVAFSVIAPNGYGGEIECLIGVDTAGVVTGLEVLRHLETPGLGAKIEDAEFQGQYEGRSLDDPETWDVEKDGGPFKQITGATISSRAVTHAAARGLELFRARRAEILALGPEETKSEEGEQTGEQAAPQSADSTTTGGERTE